MTKKRVYDWFSYYAPVLAVTAVAMGFITRIILLLNPLTVIDFTLWQWIKIFFLGALNDIAFAAIALVPAFVVYSCLNKWKYTKLGGWGIWGLLLAATFYFLAFNDISDEYGGVVPGIVNGLMIFLFACFSIKWFFPRTRDWWRRFAMHATMFIYALLMACNVGSEYTFWDEFGVRYNFIAVDYLVYTNEVIGNILESYNIPLMVAGALAAGTVLYWIMTRKGDFRDAGLPSFGHWLLNLAALAVIATAGFFWLHTGYRHFGSSNVFATELQENGCWNFLEAYNSSELDYRSFYATVPDEEATALHRSLCGQNSDGIQHISKPGQPVCKNIVLITVESLSADFFARYGNTRGITPNLDSIARQSLVFDNMFATGNRTVRGLEALTLCIPPSSGESIVKRPDCGGRFNTGDILRAQGYTTRFLYGGDSYFDNMGEYYRSNGFEVVDRKDYLPGEITFANIWGTCDEDSYNVALRLFDADYAAGKPFFTQIMTISNHRPYTYPEGRITYDGNPMSRRAAVKYTDYAIGKFLREASSRPWFHETVFVIIADHCASSAGKTSLPLECYHIPAIIWAPGFIAPRTVDKVCSQIDLMPTLFSLLGFSYDSRFYGQDILQPNFKQRAFMATYQDLGYYADGILTVLSPVRLVRQYEVNATDAWEYTETELSETAFSETELSERATAVLAEAQAYYQTANLAL